MEDFQHPIVQGFDMLSLTRLAQPPSQLLATLFQQVACGVGVFARRLQRQQCDRDFHGDGTVGSLLGLLKVAEVAHQLPQQFGRHGGRLCCRGAQACQLLGDSGNFRVLTAHHGSPTFDQCA